MKVLAFGTFDGIHPGHLFFLKAAKALGGKLTVVVSRDQTVCRVKKTCPRYSEQERLRALHRLKIAHRVRLGNLIDKYQVIREEKPDCIVLGYDQKIFVAGLRRRVGDGVRLVRCPSYLPAIYKTSKLANPLQQRLVVTLAVIIRQGKILLLKRRDPRPTFDKKWEFPGGGIEVGESEEQCLLREAKEETGYQVKILERVPKIYHTRYRDDGGKRYSVFLIFFICQAVRGRLRLEAGEARGFGWFTTGELLRVRNSFAINQQCFREHLLLIKRYL